MIIDNILLFLYLSPSFLFFFLSSSTSSSGISTQTRRRNSLDAPIKRRRVETRKRSDVSQIAFLTPLNVPPIFSSRTLQPPFFRSRGSPQQEFGWMIYPKFEFSASRIRTLYQSLENYDWNGIHIFYLFTVRLNVRFYYATWLVFHWKGILAPFIKNRLSTQIKRESSSTVSYVQ